MSTKLLISEQPLMVLPGLAVKLGLNQAIILQQIHYWLEKSTNSFDGRDWIYNTLESWQKQFPFWSERTIRRSIEALQKQGVLVCCHHWEAVGKGVNTKKVWLPKQTKWYTVDYDVLDEIIESDDPIGQTYMDKMANSKVDKMTNSKVVKMASSIYTENTQETTTETNGEASPAPEKTGDSMKEYGKKKPTLKVKGKTVSQIVETLEAEKPEYSHEEIVRIYSKKKKQTVKVFENFWRDMWKLHQKSTLPAFTAKGRGQLRLLFQRLPDKPYERLGRVLRDWIHFKNHAEKNFGAFNVPLKPNVGWCLKLVDAVMDYSEQEAELQLIAPTQQKSYDIVKQESKPEDKPMTLDELEALEEGQDDEYDT